MSVVPAVVGEDSWLNVTYSTVNITAPNTYVTYITYQARSPAPRECRVEGTSTRNDTQWHSQ